VWAHQAGLVASDSMSFSLAGGHVCGTQHARQWDVSMPQRPSLKASPAQLHFQLHSRQPQHTACCAAAPDLAVVTKNLCVEFGTGTAKRAVLKGVNFEVKRGSLHMLLGPNGCGKSTLLKALGGLVPVTQGGELHTDVPTGFVFQNPDHQVIMPTVAADVAFGLGRYDMKEEDVAQAVAAALKLVNMGDAGKRAAHTLSGGQRQRVAIAGALAENPRLLLLDELTTFLDVGDQFGVLEAVRNITRRGNVTLVATATESLPQQAPLDGQQAKRSSDSDAEQGSGSGGEGQQRQQPQQGPVTAIWVTHRFEELEFADAATYMKDGRAVFTGTSTEMIEFLRKEGARV